MIRVRANADAAGAEDLGTRIAEELLARGADHILKSVYAHR